MTTLYDGQINSSEPYLIQKLDLPSPKALIFDLDGLLLDTETLARDTFVKACHQVGWYQTDIKIYMKCIGHHGKAIERILKEGFGQDFPWERIKPIFQAIYHNHIEHHPVEIKAGAVNLLEYALEQHLPCGVATSSHRNTAELKLTQTNLNPFFQVLVSADEVDEGKPHPQPYLLASECLGEKPASCWAMEDSATGVQAAVAAGCCVFQVPDLIPPSIQLRALGHQIVDSLEDVLALLKLARKGIRVQ